MVAGEHPEVAEEDEVGLEEEGEEGDEVVAEGSEHAEETCDVVALYSGVRESESVL